MLALGGAFVLAGLILALLGRATGTAPSPAPVFPRALPAGPRSPRRHSPGVEAHPRGYRVFVPRVGSFKSIDDAEQKVLDRRWARAGSPTLGARQTRRENPALDSDAS